MNFIWLAFKNFLSVISSRTKKKVVGDDTEAPTVPSRRRRVLHGVHNQNGGIPPVPR